MKPGSDHRFLCATKLAIHSFQQRDTMEESTNRQKFYHVNSFVKYATDKVIRRNLHNTAKL